MKLYKELAEYYFSIENNHRNIRDDIVLIRSIIANSVNPVVLDIGCGTGEHINLMDREGYRCFGVDNSESMLRIARLRFPDAATYLHKNMTEIDFFDEFDLTTCLFGTFNYLIDDDDVDKVLWNTWRALKNDGSGLFEIWNALPVQQIKEKELAKVSTSLFEGTRITRERGFHLLDEPKKTVVQVNYNYTIEKDGEKKKISDRHVMRAYRKDEIESFFKNNGFKIVNLYSNPRREIYSDNSNKMLFHIKKM